MSAHKPPSARVAIRLAPEGSLPRQQRVDHSLAEIIGAGRKQPVFDHHALRMDGVVTLVLRLKV